jgi:Ankyrin repeats (3 copies)
MAVTYEDAQSLNMGSWANSFGSLFSADGSADTAERVATARARRLKPRINRYLLQPGQFIPHSAGKSLAVTCCNGPANKRAQSRLIKSERLRGSASGHISAASVGVSIGTDIYRVAADFTHPPHSELEGLHGEQRALRLHSAAVFVVTCELLQAAAAKHKRRALNDSSLGAAAVHTVVPREWSTADDKLVAQLLGFVYEEHDDTESIGSSTALLLPPAATATATAATNSGAVDAAAGQSTDSAKSSALTETVAASATAPAVVQPPKGKTQHTNRPPIKAASRVAAAAARAARREAAVAKTMAPYGSTALGTAADGTQLAVRTCGMTMPTAVNRAVSDVGGTDLQADVASTSHANAPGARVQTPAQRRAAAAAAVLAMQKAYNATLVAADGGSTLSKRAAAMKHRTAVALAKFANGDSPANRVDTFIERASGGELDSLVKTVATETKEGQLLWVWSDDKHSVHGVSALYAAVSTLLLVEHLQRERRHGHKLAPVEAATAAAAAAAASRRAAKAKAITAVSGHPPGSADSTQQHDLPTAAELELLTAADLQTKRKSLQKVVDFLLDKGCDICITCTLASSNANGRTLLHTAAELGMWQRAQWLCKARVPVDAPDGLGRTALMLACRNGQRRAMIALMALSADYDASDSIGCLALHYAAENGGVATVKAMLVAGADKTREDKQGLKAVDHARKHCNTASVDALLVYRPAELSATVYLQFLDSLNATTTSSNRTTSSISGVATDAEQIALLE